MRAEIRFKEKMNNYEKFCEALREKAREDALENLILAQKNPANRPIAKT